MTSCLSVCVWSSCIIYIIWMFVTLCRHCTDVADMSVERCSKTVLFVVWTVLSPFHEAVDDLCFTLLHGSVCEEVSGDCMQLTELLVLDVTETNVTCALYVLAWWNCCSILYWSESQTKDRSIIGMLLTLCCECWVHFVIIPIVLALLYACGISCLPHVALDEKLTQLEHNWNCIAAKG